VAYRVRRVLTPRTRQADSGGWLPRTPRSTADEHQPQKAGGPAP
jgi:hypothetical protein